jgi:hypothetical protein
MSRAFVGGDRDNEWLHEIKPTMDALINYLTRENGGIRVYEKRNYYSEELGRQVHEMSDGFAYAISNEGKWYMLPENE